MTRSKAAWGPGPWQDEPDRAEWTDARTGLACRIRRNMDFGSLCGYVGVPPSHPYFGWSYSDDIKLAPDDLKDATVEDIGIFDAFIYALKGGPQHGTIPLSMTLQAHHGINWSAEDEGLWWFGFDCGHAWDLSPGLGQIYREGMKGHQTYRDFDYVTKEVTALAFQLRQLETRVLLDEGVLQFCKAKR